jgi:hypothetical protein
MSGLSAIVTFNQPMESDADKEQRRSIVVLTSTAFPFPGILAANKASASQCSKGVYDVLIPAFLVLLLLCALCMLFLAP